MDYIDEMYRQMLAAQGRMPASGPDMTPYSQQNVTPGWLNPQKQEKTFIEAKPPEPIEYPTGYKVQVPQSEIIRENVNEALKSQMAEKQALAANVKDIYGEREGYKRDLSSALKRMRGLSESSYEAPEVDAQIKMYQQKMMEPRESVAPRDTMAELILTLGPALGGLVGGESGALAAPAAGKASRDIYEYQRKEEIDRVKNLKDATEKKLKTLIDLKKSGQESFDKAAERGLGRIKAELEATKSLATMSNDDLKRTEDNLLKLNESIAKETGSKSVDIAKMERGAFLESEKAKRANILAGIAREKIDKPTEGERKGAFQYGLMEQAEKNIQDLKQKYGDYPSMKNKWFRTQKNIAGGMFGTTVMSDLLNSKAISPDVREQIQYELSFLESIGRIQSGAAINVGEWSQMREQYFPTYGDAPQSVAAKEQQRQKALEGVSIIAGKAKPLVSKPKSVVNMFPRVLKKGSKKVTVSNEKELKEANSEGWK